MWRLVMVIVTMGAIGSACSSDELSAEEEFMKRTERFEDAEYTVTYEVDGVSQVDSVIEGAASSARVIVYTDGPSRRVDFGMDEGVHVVAEAAGYSCVSVPGPELSCFELPGGRRSDPAYGLNFYADMIQSPESYMLSRSAERSVAGVDSECFLFAHEDAFGGEPFSEICLADDGLVVYGRSMFEDPSPKNVTEAVEIVRSVPEGIFEQPFPLSPCEAGLGAPGCPAPTVEE